MEDVTNFEFDNLKLDLDEYQGTPEEIVTKKAKLAATHTDNPVLVEDVSLCFNAYKGLPGPYIKDFLKQLGTEGLYKMVSGFDDHTAYAQCIFAYCENKDSEPVLFVGKNEGKIVEPRGDTSFGWDPVFLPDGYEQTYAEMDKATKNSISHRSRSVAKLKEYLQTEE
ncbi:unnamed protein product [Moneuplotes crassus]|uniref:Inosine triphosphate pyrophosphatase n=1 Tax=Euplotes crassus TaxID=5936 RepID=A0AAD1XSZ5_EUPCR|nr:unnamed protein product [Moneuplotes crassus]